MNIATSRPWIPLDPLLDNGKRLIRKMDTHGVPTPDTPFYPSVFGGVLLGIAVALAIEHLPTRPGSVGLGLAGAIAINLCGALVLIGWLMWGGLDIPLRGRILFLSGLTVGLFLVSGSELLFVVRGKKRSYVKVAED